jgi:uncharacterized hydrophobic protein (TIGR00341 family)
MSHAMLIVRILTPPDRTDAVLAMLRDDPNVDTVIFHAGAAVDPPGDVISCETTRDNTTPLIARLRELGVTGPRSVSLGELERIDPVDARDTGVDDDAIVWEQVAQRAHDEARLGRGYLLLMAVAGVLAGAALLTNNVVLIVGAMIVSPDFGPTAGLAVGLITGRYDRARESLAALVIGFGVAAIAAFVLTVIGRLLGHIPADLTDTPVEDLVLTVNGVAFVVAFAAGIAGAVSLGTAKSGAVVGVAVSITTIPAAANIGIAAAVGKPDVAVQSALMLLTNVTGLVAAELLTFVVARRIATRQRRRAERV